MTHHPSSQRVLCARTWLALLGVAAFALSQASAGVLVQFRTVMGDIEVELFEDKPVTRDNFLRYVRSGAYQNMFFHRCIPGFVVQGGGFSTLDPTSTNDFLSVNKVPAFAPITNEFYVGRRISNEFGTIAMAKLEGNPNSATSEWFFNLGDNGPNLDGQNGGFTVFGRVIGGTNVLSSFNLRDKTMAYGLVDLTWWYPTVTVFSDLPVNYADLRYPRYNDLVYVDVTLLQVQVGPGPMQGRAISWNSVAARTNRVQFTTNMPPVWSLLAATNGNGGRMTVVDSSPAGSKRFYRVTVDY